MHIIQHTPFIIGKLVIASRAILDAGHAEVAVPLGSDKLGALCCGRRLCRSPRECFAQACAQESRRETDPLVSRLYFYAALCRLPARLVSRLRHARPGASRRHGGSSASPSTPQQATSCSLRLPIPRTLAAPSPSASSSATPATGHRRRWAGTHCSCQRMVTCVVGRPGKMLAVWKARGGQRDCLEHASQLGDHMFAPCRSISSAPWSCQALG